MAKRCPLCKSKLVKDFDKCPVCGYPLKGDYQNIEKFSKEYRAKLDKDLSDLDKMNIPADARPHMRPPHRARDIVLIVTSIVAAMGITATAATAITYMIQSQQEKINQTYTVKFVDGEGNILQNETLKKGDEIIYKQSQPTKESDQNYDYVFTGWDPIYNIGDKASKDVTYTAQFTKVDSKKYLEATNIDSSNKTCSIAWNPSMGNPTALKIPNRIESNGVTYNVTAIASDKYGVNSNSNSGYGAFEDCSSLKYVEIPDSVATIEANSFKGCSSLISINLPSGVNEIANNLFENCESLTSFNVPNNIITIGDGAFKGCTALASVTIPESVTTIGHEAFYCGDDVTGVKSVDLGNTDPDKGYWMIGAKENYVASSDFAANAAKFKDSALHDQTWKRVNSPYVTTNFEFTLNDDGASYSATLKNKTVTEIEIPSTYSGTEAGGKSLPVTVIKDMSNAIYLESIKIPDSIVAIAKEAFNNCSLLKSIAIPDSVKTIGSGAFKGCTSLVNLTLPSDLEEIPETMCYQCTKLKSIDIPSSVTKIGNSAFDCCIKLENVNIPDDNSIRNIEAYAFSTTAIKEFTLPYDVEILGTGAFSYCYSLETFNFNSKLRVIGINCFYDDSALSGDITFPETLDTIYDGAYTGCLNVKSFSFAGISEEEANKSYFQFMPYPGRYMYPVWSENYETLKMTESGQDKDILTTLLNNGASIIKQVMILVDQDNGIYGNGTSLDTSTLLIYTKQLTDFSLVDNLHSIGLNTEKCSLSTSDVSTIKVPSAYYYTDTNPGREDKSYLVDITKFGHQYSNRGPVDVIREYCTNLVLSPTINYLNPYACVSLYLLNNIQLPKNLKNISQEAFGNCSSLTTLYVPKSVTELDYGCLVGSYISKLIFEDTNTSFKDEDERYTFTPTINWEDNATQLLDKCCSATMFSENYDDGIVGFTQTSSTRGVTSSEYIYAGDTITYSIDFSEYEFNSAPYLVTVFYFDSRRDYNYFDEAKIVDGNYYYFSGESYTLPDYDFDILPYIYLYNTDYRCNYWDLRPLFGRAQELSSQNYNKGILTFTIKFGQIDIPEFFVDILRN